MPKIQYRCPECGSDEVLQDAYVRMNTDEVQTFDAKRCAECGATFDEATEFQVPDEPMTFTAFCQQATGEGTIWINNVTAINQEVAVEEARKACARDWGCEVTDVHLLGLAEGDVNILQWEDIE